MPGRTTAAATACPTTDGPSTSPSLAVRPCPTSEGQEDIDFHWWDHSVIHGNMPGNPVDFEQPEGRVRRYLGHGVRKNVAVNHSAEVPKLGVTDPWESPFSVAAADVATHPEESNTEFAPYWI